MYLKRVYEQGEAGDERRVAHVQIRRGGEGKQKFSADFISNAARAGWLTMDGKAGTITLKTDKGAAVFRITRTPGYYCCHCKVPLADAAAAKEHLAEKHAGERSPDPENPAGYMRTHAFKTLRTDGER